MNNGNNLNVFTTPSYLKFLGCTLSIQFIQRSAMPTACAGLDFGSFSTRPGSHLPSLTRIRIIAVAAIPALDNVCAAFDRDVHLRRCLPVYRIDIEKHGCGGARCDVLRGTSAAMRSGSAPSTVSRRRLGRSASLAPAVARLILAPETRRAFVPEYPWTTAQSSLHHPGCLAHPRKSTRTRAPYKPHYVSTHMFIPIRESPPHESSQQTHGLI